MRSISLRLKSRSKRVSLAVYARYSEIKEISNVIMEFQRIISFKTPPSQGSAAF